MADMLEVLFTTDLDNNQASCTAWDYRTGTNLMTYKGGGNIQSQALHLLKAEYLLAANCSKPLLHVWPINAQEQVTMVRFVMPGQVNAMAISSDGFYLVAGIKETIYIWHLTTGRMLNAINKHYQPINCIKFLDDDGYFVTAGQDGSVLVWNLTQCICREDASEEDGSQSPLYCFNDHGLPVTQLHVGCNGLRAYIYTVSLDRTCKVYDLWSGQLLLSVVFPEALTSVVCNAMETAVYVGTAQGIVYEFHMRSVPRTKEYHLDQNYSNMFKGHTDAVSCLTLSLDGQSLISGAKDSLICIWDIPSRQLLKTLPQKGAITNLYIRLSDPRIFHPEHKPPKRFCGNLQRMINPPDDDEEDIIEVRITESQAEEYEERVFGAPRLTDDLDPCPVAGTTFNSSTLPKNNKSAPSSATNKELEELKKLREENQRLKAINKKLFETASYTVLGKTKKRKA